VFSPGSAVIKTSHGSLNSITDFVVPLGGTTSFQASNFTVWMTSSDVYDGAVGTLGKPFVDAHVENVFVVGSSDGFYLSTGDGVSTGVFKNVGALTQWDTVLATCQHGHLIFENPQFVATGNWNGGGGKNYNIARAINASGITPNDCVIDVYNPQWNMQVAGGVHGAIGVNLGGSVTVNVRGGMAVESGGDEPAFAVNSVIGLPPHAGNFHVTSDTNYDNPIYGAKNDDNSSYYWKVHLWR